MAEWLGDVDRREMSLIKIAGPPSTDGSRCPKSFAVPQNDRVRRTEKVFIMSQTEAGLFNREIEG